MTTQPAMKPIPKNFSVYLDLLRFGAAMMVLFFHIKSSNLGPSYITKLIPSRGHDFVILFFVLSGYVISATVDRKKDQSLRDYALDRMARIYSVAIPALLLSSILILYYQPPLIEVAKVLCNFLFLGQVGLVEIYPYANQPFWSLCYEVMYYVGFACFVFLRGKTRLAWLLLFILVAGPKVLLLMPCWLLGVLIYHKRDCIKLNLAQGLFVAFIIPAIAALLLNKVGFDKHTTAFTTQLLGDYSERLGFSGGFIVDYARAIIIAIHLYAMRYVMIHWPKIIEKLIIEAAGMSFTLYLMHIPMIVVLTRVVPLENRNELLFLFCAIAIPLICYTISLFTEAKRPQLRAFLDRCMPRLNAR